MRSARLQNAVRFAKECRAIGQVVQPGQADDAVDEGIRKVDALELGENRTARVAIAADPVESFRGLDRDDLAILERQIARQIAAPRWRVTHNLARSRRREPDGFREFLRPCIRILDHRLVVGMATLVEDGLIVDRLRGHRCWTFIRRVACGSNRLVATTRRGPRAEATTFSSATPARRHGGGFRCWRREGAPVGSAGPRSAMRRRCCSSAQRAARAMKEMYRRMHETSLCITQKRRAPASGRRAPR